MIRQIVHRYRQAKYSKRNRSRNVEADSQFEGAQVFGITSNGEFIRLHAEKLSQTLSPVNAYLETRCQNRDERDRIPVARPGYRDHAGGLETPIVR
jgi:hypothetical protein